MELNEVAAFLNVTRDEVKRLIERGVELPVSKAMVKLESSELAGKLFVTDEQLQRYIDSFEREEPGRHPPVDVRRQLLVESRFACGNCGRETPLQFHHLIEWSKLKHHDPQKMIALCGACHDRCGNGQIDRKSQEMIKTRLRNESIYRPSQSDDVVTARRASDLRNLQDLFSIFPRPVIDNFLGRAANDRIIIDDISVVDGAIGLYYSTFFFLTDAGLRDRFETFFRCWREIFELSDQSHRDIRWTGIAVLILDHESPSELWTKHEAFKSIVTSTQTALRELNEYLTVNYPDLDMIESDMRSVSEWRQLQKEIEANFASRSAKLSESLSSIEN